MYLKQLYSKILDLGVWSHLTMSARRTPCHQATCHANVFSWIRMLNKFSPSEGFSLRNNGSCTEDKMTPSTTFAVSSSVTTFFALPVFDRLLLRFSHIIWLALAHCLGQIDSLTLLDHSASNELIQTSDICTRIEFDFKRQEWTDDKLFATSQFISKWRNKFHQVWDMKYQPEFVVLGKD